MAFIAIGVVVPIYHIMYPQKLCKTHFWINLAVLRIMLGKERQFSQLSKQDAAAR